MSKFLAVRLIFHNDGSPFSSPCLSKLIQTLLPSTKGLCKENKIPKIQVYYGSGWVGPGLSRNFVLFWKINPK